MAIRLVTLGGLRGAHDGAAIERLSAQELSAALLVYLAIERSATRDALMAILWPDQDEDTGGRRLSSMLFSLRRKLGDDCLESHGREIRAGTLDADAREFEQAADHGQAEEAVALYAGPFLHAVHLASTTAFENWVDRMRARYARAFRRVSKAIVEKRSASGDLAGAIAAARAWVAPDPMDDEAQHRLIEFLARNGERTEALKQYALYEALLKPEGLEALDETKTLIKRIRESGSLREPEPVPAATSLDERVRSGLAPRLAVMRKLGQGSTAAVYLARDPRLKRLVAVKVLNPELAANDIARHRFEREAQSAALIAHTHVAQIYDFDLLDGRLPYIVMEFVDGRALSDVLAARGPLPAAEVRSILGDVASALAAVHDHGVIHRDVRPGNILIENRSERPVLTDFGTAALLESGNPDSVDITPPDGARLGDVRYMSPERLKGARATELGDIYALGIVAWEMLTGTHPLGDESSTQLIVAILSKKLRPLRSVVPDVAPALASIIDRCLAREPGQRPRAKDVAALLSAAK